MYLSKSVNHSIYQQSVIKEEIIISDIEDDDCVYNINNENINTSQSEDRLLPIVSKTIIDKNERLKIAGRNVRKEKRNQSVKILDETKEKVFFDSINPKQLRPVETEQLTLLKAKDQVIVKSFTIANVADDLDTAIEKFSKTYCINCKTLNPVQRRKPRCDKCKIQLHYKCISGDEKNYKTYNGLCNHLKIHHLSKVKQYKCNYCDRTFNSSNHVYSHERVCGKEPIFKCNLCNYAARYKSCLTAHTNEKHLNQLRFHCHECGKEYKNIRSLKRHREIYCGKLKMFQCEHCPKKGYRKDEMLFHLKCKHSWIFETTTIPE